MQINLSNKIILCVVLLMIGGAIVVTLFSKETVPAKKEQVEFTSKRILAIISDTQWREGHIQFDHLKLMGFNLTVIKASQYKSDMLSNADVVMFDYNSDSVNIKEKDSIRDFVEKKGNNVIFISPAGLNIWWKKEKYSNTPFINLSFKAIDTWEGLNISGYIIPPTQHYREQVYQLNRLDLQNIKVWVNHYFILPNKAQTPVAYTLDFPSGGHYVIYSGSNLALLPPGLIQSLIYLDEPHIETIYTKDNIKNNFTYIIRIDDVGYQSKNLGREKDWNSMLAFDKIADDYGFGVNHLVTVNFTNGAGDLVAYLREYKNGKWMGIHGWNHDKPDGVHPEFEIDNKATQENILNKSKERFYELFGYYPEYITTPWNVYRYNFSEYITDNDYGSFTAFKKYGFFVYSLDAEQGNAYTPFIVDDIIIIQYTNFVINSSVFDKLINGSSDNGWIIESMGHYFDKNILENSKSKYATVSRYTVWNPNPNEFAEFLHALSGLQIEWKLGGNNSEIVLNSMYTVPAGFTLKLVDSNNIISTVYIDNNKYNYFTDKKIVFPEISTGIHTVKISFKNQ